MRFRVWDKRNNRMGEVVRLHLADDFCADIRYEENGEPRFDCIGAADMELMQATGLKDRTGKDIFDGDIVRMKSGRSGIEKRVVYFRDGAFRFDTQKTLHAGFAYSNESTEIIGNIWQDPGLVAKG